MNSLAAAVSAASAFDEPVELQALTRPDTSDSSLSALASEGPGPLSLPRSVGWRRFIVAGALFLGDAIAFLAGGAALVPLGSLDGEMPHVLALIAVVTLAFYWSRQLYPGYRLHGYELLRRRCDAALRVGAVSCAAMLLLTGAWNGRPADRAFPRDRGRGSAADAISRPGPFVALRHLGRAGGDPRRTPGGRRRRRLLYPALAIRHPSATGGLGRPGSFSRPDRGRAALPARGREASAPLRERRHAGRFPGPADLGPAPLGNRRRDRPSLRRRGRSHAHPRGFCTGRSTSSRRPRG